MLEKTLDWLLNIITNPLFVIGLLFIFIASYLKDEENVKSKITKPAKFFKNELRPLPKWLYLTMIVVGFIISVIGVLQVGGVIQTNSTIISSTGQISLTSVSYLVDNFDPRRIDLSTSERDGIPASAGHSLQFFDLWVSSSNEIGSRVRAEIFADGKSIGTTEEQIVVKGQSVNLGDVHITNYEDAKFNGAWQVQSDWKEISIVLQTTIDGQLVQTNETKIRLNPNGKAWFIPPPNPSLILVAYRINNEMELIMDLSTVIQTGIPVTEGDTFTLTQAWYKSNTGDSTKNIHLEAHLSSEVYDPTTLKVSSDIAIYSGINSLGDLGDKLNWTIPAEEKNLVMTLARNDRTILDRYTIPLRNGSPSGLVPLTSVVQWHFSEFTYFDFEQTDDLMGWEPTENTAIGIRNEYAFTGSNALAVGNKMSENQTFTIRRVPFRASYITGQVYWPKAENISVSWAQICLGGDGECVPISQEPGQWNPFFVDLQKMQDDNGIPYSEKEIPSIYFQGAFNGVNQNNQYLFYIDGIQIYPVKNP